MKTGQLTGLAKAEYRQLRCRCPPRLAEVQQQQRRALSGTGPVAAGRPGPQVAPKQVRQRTRERGFCRQRTGQKQCNDVKLWYSPSELSCKPEERLLEVVVGLGRNLKVLEVLFAVEGDCPSLDFAFLYTAMLFSDRLC